MHFSEGKIVFILLRVLAGSRDFRAATSSSNIPRQFWLLKRLRAPSKLNRVVPGSRRPNSPSGTVLGGVQLEAPYSAVPPALVVFQPPPRRGGSPAVPAPAHLHFLLRLRPFGPARLPSQMIPPRGGHRLHRRELEPPPGPVA